MALNKAAVSKINYTALLIALVNVAGVLGFIPKDILPSVITLTNILGPSLIIVFRTWYTEKD